MRDEDRESRRLFFFLRTRLCLHIDCVRTRISWQNWRVLRFLWILPRLAHESCIKRCSPPDRRSDKNHEGCQQWHDHACRTYTQWFSFTQSFVCFQSECSVWTCTPETHRYLQSWCALGEWLKKTILVILWHKSHNISSRLIRRKNFISKAISRTMLWVNITPWERWLNITRSVRKINRSSNSLALRSFQASSLAMRCVREESGKERFLL